MHVLQNPDVNISRHLEIPHKGFPYRLKPLIVVLKAPPYYLLKYKMKVVRTDGVSFPRTELTNSTVSIPAISF